MIYTQLLGGLGNIMFIVANTVSLAHDRKQKYLVSCDTQSCTKRPQEDLWMKTIFKDVKKTKKRPAYVKKLYRERTFRHHKIPSTDHMAIHGYFQSAKNFNHNRELIVNLFTSYKTQITKQLGSKMPDTTLEIVSIHIRRGDYLKFPDVHLAQNISYYENAMKHFQDKKYFFIIFSMDFQWINQQPLFMNLENKMFMKGTSDIEDMYLMSMCDHNIIANSSFSWWGSYLGEQETRKVVAPKKWFNTKHMPEEDWQDIYCDKWIVEE